MKRVKDTTPKVKSEAQKARDLKFTEAGKPHRFGAEQGNTPTPLREFHRARDFYRWLDTATEEDCRQYIQDETKPLRFRLFLKRFIKNGTVKDEFELTNQTEGKPKETIAVAEHTRIIGLSISEIRAMKYDDNEDTQEDTLRD